MADEPKQPWYKSIPGILTAATGFIAALSGLVAGLNQLGAFRREPPAAVAGAPPTPADNTARDSLSSGARPGDDSGALRSTTSPATAPGPTVPTAPPPRPAAGTNPSPARKPARPASSADTKTGPLMVPKGTTLSLTVPTRTCAPADGARPLTARLEAPVELNGATVIPAGATAMLRLRRAGDPPEPRARLDSLVRSGQALLVTSAQVQIPRASVSGACIRAGGQLTVVLGEAVLVPRS